MLLRQRWHALLLPLVCLFLLLLATASAKGSSTDYYAILGLKRADRPTERDFKKAYRALSKKYHPDRNPGDEAAKDRFVEVAAAYEVLSDKKKKSTYDKYGEEGLKREAQGGSAHHDPYDVFSQFFGGGARGGRRKGPNLESTVEIELDAIYKGSSFTVNVEKQIVCEECSGSGADPAHETPACAACDGHGVRVMRIQLAPGMFQQVQQQCDVCRGRGQVVTHACPRCKGNKVYRAQESYTVDVPAGLPRGERVVFEGEAEESPDVETGDLVITVREASAGHPSGWYRRTSDLYRTEPLSLADALLGGWTREIARLDGTILTVSRPKGVVTQPGQVEAVDDEGMPAWQSVGYATGKGKAFITWNVILPAVGEDTPAAVALAKALGRTGPAAEKDEL